MLTIDTTNMCSHLQRKLFEEDGIYHHLWIAMQDDLELTAESVLASFTSTAMARKFWSWQERQLPKSSERINYVRFKVQVWPTSDSVGSDCTHVFDKREIEIP